VSPGRRRRAVVVLVERFGVSQRRACRVDGQHRSVRQYAPQRPDGDQHGLRARLREIANGHPRWGWGKAHAIAKSEGLVVNRKRTHRLWKDERLQRRRWRDPKALSWKVTAGTMLVEVSSRVSRSPSTGGFVVGCGIWRSNCSRARPRLSAQSSTGQR